MKKFLINTVLQAGKIILRDLKKDIEINFKVANEIVTATDKKVEDFIKEKINKKFPRHSIIAEESTNSQINSDHIWYIDPIDGTTNFSRKIPLFCISIGYEIKEKGLQAGIIYLPVLNEIYYTEKNKGAFLNSKRIYTRKETKMLHLLGSTGFSCIREGRNPNGLKIMDVLLPKIHDIRRTGSAAIDLCNVASGRTDFFWEMNLKPWDYMAGKLLVEEAGGTVTDFMGKQNIQQRKEVLAISSLALQKKLLPFFNI